MTPFDRLFRALTRPVTVVAGMLLIVLCIRYVDRPLAEFFFQAHIRTHYPWLAWVTRIGLGPLYFAGFFLLALFFRFVKKNPLYEARAWFLWFCTVITASICLVLKVNIGRARPGLWLYHHVEGFYGFDTHSQYWSLPSGHTTIVMSVAVGFGIIFPRYLWALLCAGLAVAASRVLLTHHYLSDVLVAAWLVVVEMGVLVLLFRRWSWFSAVVGSRASLVPNVLQEMNHGV